MAIRAYRLLHIPSGKYCEGMKYTLVGYVPIFRSSSVAQYLNARQLDYHVTKLIYQKMNNILDECKLESYEYTPITKGATNFKTYRKNREAKIILGKLKII